MLRKCVRVLWAAWFAALLCSASPASAQVAPPLGSATSFAVLGATPSVTCTGASLVTGDVGISPAAAITGFPVPCTDVGTLHAADATAAAAQTAVTAAYVNLQGQTCPPANNLTGIDLGTLMPLVSGVYCFASSAQLTGSLVLNAQGNPNAAWVFQIGSTLTTASASSVTVTNGGPATFCNVFWQVGSSATLGTTTQFKGNILALASVTLNTGAGLLGRALARTAAVTLDTNNVNASACAASGPPSPTPPAPPGVPALPPAFVIFLALGLIAVGYYQVRRRARG